MVALNRKRMPRLGVTHAGRKGGATSAASMSGVTGTRGRWDALWVPGEGWVKWTEIYEQVDRAFQAWRWKCALSGRLVLDAAERRDAEIRRLVLAKRQRVLGPKFSNDCGPVGGVK